MGRVDAALLGTLRRCVLKGFRVSWEFEGYEGENRGGGEEGEARDALTRPRDDVRRGRARGLVWRDTCAGIGDPRYLEMAVSLSLSSSNRLSLAPGVVPSAASLGSSRTSGCC